MVREQGDDEMNNNISDNKIEFNREEAILVRDWFEDLTGWAPSPEEKAIVDRLDSFLSLTYKSKEKTGFEKIWKESDKAHRDGGYCSPCGKIVEPNTPIHK